jgi:hypothetical protein
VQCVQYAYFLSLLILHRIHPSASSVGAVYSIPTSSPLNPAQNSTFLFLCQYTEFLLPLTLNTAQNTTFLFLCQCTEFLLPPSVTTEQMFSFPPSLFFIQKENLYSPSLHFLSTSVPFPTITYSHYYFQISLLQLLFAPTKLFLLTLLFFLSHLLTNGQYSACLFIPATFKKIVFLFLASPSQFPGTIFFKTDVRLFNHLSHSFPSLLKQLSVIYFSA